MKKVENFEAFPVTTFEVGKTYEMPSGLQILLMPPVTYFGKAQGVEPSGIMLSTFRNSQNEIAKQIFEKNELVIGDGSELSLLFPKGAKNLKFQYYQVENYTKEDAGYTGKKLEDLTEAEKGFVFTAFNNLEKRPQQTMLQVPPAYTEVRWGEFNTTPFHQLIFSTSFFGNLHLDQISWEDL